MKTLTGVDLEEIKRWLEHGDQQEIADDAECDPSYVSRVLSGHAINHAVLDAALEKAIQRKAKILSKMDRLKQLQ